MKPHHTMGWCSVTIRLIRQGNNKTHHHKKANIPWDTQRNSLHHNIIINKIIDFIIYKTELIRMQAINICFNHFTFHHSYQISQAEIIGQLHHLIYYKSASNIHSTSLQCSEVVMYGDSSPTPLLLYCSPITPLFLIFRRITCSYFVLEILRRECYHIFGVFF